MASSSGASKSKREDKNDLIDIDDISNGTKGFIDKVLGDVGKSSAVKQLLLGSISGWCTGFITMKVGKLIAVVVGGSIILLQVANHQGYIKVDWDKVHKQVEKVEDKATGHSPKWMEKVGALACKNAWAAAGFLGGFFFGLASS
ncbi:FUN14 domain-containing protein 2 isoform X2 [Zootermopsis nevadensis]|uniref:FUN14 domain-containing protein 2 isoform X2 n=1 Tax=Zootermopsis nevadensis TaxID=136037 RepID=UPI000B8E2FAE|nr:FUN14 domain-containing protein 2 isoform X2 [Zootermopsis nevadensis]